MTQYAPGGSQYAMEKGLPASVEAEKFVLGSVLLDNAVAPEVVGLAEDAFTVESHRVVLRSYREMFDNSVPIDYMTLSSWLEASGNLDKVGGLSYVASLTDGLPRTENIAAYVKIVHERHQLRRLIYAGESLIRRAIDLDKPLDLASFGIEQIIATVGDNHHGAAQSIHDTIHGFPGGLELLLNPSRGARGLPTGFVDLDQVFVGFEPGALTVIGARPSVGKTALALNIAANLLRHAAKDAPAVLLFSLEMNRIEIFRRLLWAEARIGSNDFKRGNLSEQSRAQAMIVTNHISNWPLYVVDTGALDTSDFHAQVTRFAARHRLGLVIVDYLQLMESKLHAKQGKTAEVTAISRKLKMVASDRQVPVLALSQLSREIEKRKGEPEPKLSDLRESGGIEQDCDNVLLLYRPAKEGNTVAVKVAKQRNGPVGSVRLAFLPQYTRFESLVVGGTDE